MIEDRAAAGPDGSAPEPEPDAVVPPRPARYRWYVLLAVVVALLALPLFRPIISSYNYVLTLGALILMWVAMSSSWNILGGYAGYISLGHSVFMGVGGYVAGVLLYYNNISPFLTAVLLDSVDQFSAIRHYSRGAGWEIGRARRYPPTH